MNAHTEVRVNIVHIVILIFLLGAAWATMMWRIVDNGSGIRDLRTRTTHIEHYLTLQSKGIFQRNDPPAVSNDPPAKQ